MPNGRANLNAVLQALAQLPQPGRAPLTPPFFPTGQIPGGQVPATLDPSFPIPESPPPAPSLPLDRDIIERHLALLGPAPTPPPATQPSRLQRIALALQGFGAGVQGQGPQFLAALNEQRERPQREFEEQQRQFDRQKLQLGLRGLEAAQSAEDKRQARQQAEADRNFELDVADRARQLGFDNQVEIEKLRDAMLTKRQREDDERAAELARGQAEAARQKEIRAQTDRLFDDFKGEKAGISRAQARRFANFEVLGVPLTAQDRKAYDRTVAPIRQGGTTAGGREKLARFETLKGQLGAARARGDVDAERAIIKRLDEMAARMPSYIETGYDPTGMWPFAKIRGTNPQATPQPATATATGQPQAESPNRAGARAKLVANGFNDAEATRELDRLGIK